MRNNYFHGNQVREVAVVTAGTAGEAAEVQENGGEVLPGAEVAQVPTNNRFPWQPGNSEAFLFSLNFHYTLSMLVVFLGKFF